MRLFFLVSNSSSTIPVDMVLTILITTLLASVLFLVNLRSWRGHRVYLLSSVLGLNILSLSSVFEDSSMTRVGLHVLLGPSLANISLLRLLLLLDIVSSSKLSHLFNSPWSLIQLSLGPLWGLAKVYLCLNIPVYPTHLEKTLNGIEAFWDFGCCLLYLCLRIIIFLNSKILLKSHDSTKMGTIAKESCQRPQWRLVANDGYILSITASLACRGCILVLPSTYLPWILPFVIILDMRTIFIREFRNNTKTKDTSSIYVTRVETSRTTSSIFTNYTVSDIESLQSQPLHIPRSITFTERCALSSILSAVPQTSMTRSKTWSGPLDETLRKLVGDKHTTNKMEN